MNINIVEQKLEIRGFIESESKPGMYYLTTYVRETDGREIKSCTCPNYNYRGATCKHITKMMQSYKEKIANI